VIPLSRHFLCNLRRRLSSVRKKGGNFIVRLNKQELADIKLWSILLDQANQGISLNGLTMKNPTKLTFSDSCPLGLGGFTSNGRAWRLKVNPKSRTSSACKANNILEFLAMVITIWLLLIELDEQGAEEELILALGDNTSAIGWMVRTNHLKKHDFSYNAANFISRKVAQLLSKSKNFMVSQHVAGKQNQISDWLTFEGEERTETGTTIPNPIAFDCPTNVQLTHRYRSLFPQHVPSSFAISPLPTEVLLFAEHTLQILELSLEQREKLLLKTKIGSGGVGRASAPSHWDETIPLLAEYPQGKKISFSKFSLNFTADQTLIPNRVELLVNVTSRRRGKLLRRPQGLWLRRSGTISAGHPCTNRYETAEAYQAEADPDSNLS